MTGACGGGVVHQVRRPDHGAGSPVWVVLVGLALALVAACASSPTTDPGDTAGQATTTSASSTTPGRPAPGLRAVGVPAASEPVGPPAGSSLAMIRRDCGISAPLPGGATLWLYCDTALFTSDDVLRWFVNTSAALATDDEPLVMRERPAADGRVEPFLRPRPDYPVCPDGEGRFTWPTAAVTVPRRAGEADEVVAVYYHNVCVVPSDFVGRDGGLASFDPGVVDARALGEGGEPPLLRGALVDDRLLPGSPALPSFGQAAVRVGDLVYAYRCAPAHVPCEVARAPADLEALADPERYEVWTGSGWVEHGDDGGVAEPMGMPEPRRGFKPSVGWLEDLGVFVWVDHRMGDAGVLLVRVARDPWGPWSEPAVARLPGCEGRWPDVCFAVEVHPHLSSGDEVGVTWFDPTFAPGVEVPTRFARLTLDVR